MRVAAAADLLMLLRVGPRERRVADLRHWMTVVEAPSPYSPFVYALPLLARKSSNSFLPLTVIRMLGQGSVNTRAVSTAARGLRW